MKTIVEFGGQDRHFKLKQAILVYQDDNGAAAASVHPVELNGSGDGKPGSGRPTIQAGAPLTIQALESIVQSLGRGAKPGGFISPHIISLALDGMTWFCPAGRRRIWFKPSNDGDAQRLKALNGKPVYHPPLLFQAEGRNLNVFALPKNERPSPKTSLFRAPYYNLSEGHMCNGNLELPVVAPENTALFERAFFGSAFTHSSAGNLTRFPGGHTALWEHLAARKRTPDESFWIMNLLRSGSRTVKDALK